MAEATTNIFAEKTPFTRSQRIPQVIFLKKKKKRVTHGKKLLHSKENRAYEWEQKKQQKKSVVEISNITTNRKQ